MSGQSLSDVIVLGAGAAGLMCAAVAAQRGKIVTVLDHGKRPAEKVRISGGGRCNFTNIHSAPAHFISSNPHFCISALKGYTAADFIKLVDSYKIAYHTKTLGQLFCDQSAEAIVSMLLSECQKGEVRVHTQTPIEHVQKTEGGFYVSTPHGGYHTKALVVATGGLSIPKMGATGLGYRIAQQFEMPVVATRAGLVPFTLDDAWLQFISPLSGIAVQDTVGHYGKISFREALLFTHRGISGPVVLQLSSYWQQGQPVSLNLLPDTDMLAHLQRIKREHPKQEIDTSLAHVLPKRLAQMLVEKTDVQGRLADLSNEKLQRVADMVNRFTFVPQGTEGYRTAEVTVGGVDTRMLSSKTMESTQVKGLYFIGEVVDVTGHLGGYNFQWAWSSAVAAARAICA